MSDATDNKDMQTAEQEAAHAYDHGGVLPAEHVDAPMPKIVQSKPEPQSSETADLSASAQLDAWFETTIKNSGYSQDTTLYNKIQASYRALRRLVA